MQNPFEAAENSESPVFGHSLGNDPQNADFAETFGARLVSARLVDEMSIERARRAVHKSGQRFDQVLTKLGLISENDLAVQLAAQLAIPLAPREKIPPEPVLPDVIRFSFVRQHGILPLALAGGGLSLAVTDPLNEEPVRAVGYLTGLATTIALMTPGDFEHAVQTLYVGHQSGAGGAPADDRADEASDTDLQRLKDMASEAPVIRLVNQIIAKAVEARASDIHIEPLADALNVRFRIDGVLRIVQSIAFGLRAAVTSRIKIMAKLDIAERRMPQDGRLKIAVRGVDIDFRISTIPTIYGESIVLRILDRRHVELDFQKLGFDPDIVAQLRRLMRQPNGIILVTGPTGSGKTTTLYTALKELNSPDVKILTVEDPIEYQLDGINQVQVQPNIGLDFPHALRSILRQDPDIVMIGEIRDLETARIAIQASLTGHLVFSTLHTNSAAASITRLIDMGIENYLIASTLKGILAQRLVRRLCTACAQPLPDSMVPATMPALKSAGGRPPQFQRQTGCEECRQTGFSGRTTIAELMIADDGLHQLIVGSASDARLETAARASGMATLYESGMRKAGRGETTIEEVMRVTRMD